MGPPSKIKWAHSLEWLMKGVVNKVFQLFGGWFFEYVSIISSLLKPPNLDDLYHQKIDQFDWFFEVGLHE